MPKGKVFAVLKHHDLNACWGVKVKLHSFFTSILDREGSASRSGRFVSRERGPDSNN